MPEKLMFTKEILISLPRRNGEVVRPLTKDQTEIQRLKLELETTQQERDSLKQTVIILAKDK